jgi:hypothetical protein
MGTAVGDILRYDIPGSLSACIIPQRSPVSIGGPGDAVLLDPGRGILAVADSPDRNPDAAGAFLEKFHERLVLSGLLPAGKDHEKDFERIVAFTEELVREIPYHESTTFSCLAILDGNTAGLLHTGDSLVLLLDEHGDTEQLSRTNHFIVGRCPRLYQAGLVSLARARLVVLATDGLTELARSYGMSVQDFFRRHIDPATHASVIQSFIDISVNITRRLDDLGAAVALPSSMPSLPGEKGGHIILKKNSKYKVD